MNQKNLKSAFTLIELLVVIAIIAILAAILFPVLTQARTAAKKTVTVSNMKQAILAVQMYCGDHDDILPPRRRVGFNAPFGDDPGPAMSWENIINPYVKNMDVMKGGTDSNQAYTTPYGRGRRSFAVAENVFEGIQLRPGNTFENPGTRPQKVTLSQSFFPEPSATIALGERRMCPSATDPWNQGQWFWCSDFYNTRALGMRYGNNAGLGQISYSYNESSIFARLDGSVRSFSRGGSRVTTTEDTRVGALFPGYQEKADFWVGSINTYWDKGMSCTGSSPYTDDTRGTPVGGRCTVPGETN